MENIEWRLNHINDKEVLSGYVNNMLVYEIEPALSSLRLRCSYKKEGYDYTPAALIAQMPKDKHAVSVMKEIAEEHYKENIKVAMNIKEEKDLTMRLIKTKGQIVPGDIIQYASGNIKVADEDDVYYIGMMDPDIKAKTNKVLPFCTSDDKICHGDYAVNNGGEVIFMNHKSLVDTCNALGCKKVVLRPEHFCNSNLENLQVKDMSIVKVSVTNDYTGKIKATVLEKYDLTEETAADTVVPAEFAIHGSPQLLESVMSETRKECPAIADKLPCDGFDSGMVVATIEGVTATQEEFSGVTTYVLPVEYNMAKQALVDLYNKPEPAPVAELAVAEEEPAPYKLFHVQFSTQTALVNFINENRIGKDEVQSIQPSTEEAAGWKFTKWNLLYWSYTNYSEDK
jgi:hypothetical protein